MCTFNKFNPKNKETREKSYGTSTQKIDHKISIKKGLKDIARYIIKDLKVTRNPIIVCQWDMR